jgi:hypothetical protein
LRGEKFNTLSRRELRGFDVVEGVVPVVECRWYNIHISMAVLSLRKYGIMGKMGRDNPHTSGVWIEFSRLNIALFPYRTQTKCSS